MTENFKITLKLSIFFRVETGLEKKKKSLQTKYANN